jgi:uncharacterized iron-regulated membrane protein
MKIENLVSRLRQFRTVHKWVGISIFFFMVISSVTGLLLGWKKDVDLLQPPAQSGSTSQLDQWVSFDQVVRSADRALDSVLHEKAEIERLDARPDKGIIKVIYLNGFWEVQIDGKTGKALSVGQRHADWIEHIHDGSFVSDGFKLAYTNYLGWGLLLMSLTGFWLWYGPQVEGARLIK